MFNLFLTQHHQPSGKPTPQKVGATIKNLSKMGVDTKFRTNKQVDLIKERLTIEKALGVPVKIEVEKEHARYYFTYNGEQRMLWLFTYESDFANKPNPSYYNCFSLGAYGSAIEIMRKIAPYYGGWLDVNDCDDVPDEFIEATPELSEQPLTDAERLYISIAKECGVSDADKVLQYIMNHKALILLTDFGLSSNQ